MSSPTPKCPKCQHKMVQGYILDITHGARIVSQWVEGPPLKSFWLGTKIPGNKSVPVGTFRCPDCGFLESYARPEFAAR